MIKERELIEKLCSSEKTYSDWLLLRLEAIEFFTKPEQEQEPVAWIIETEIYGKLSEWVCTDKKHYMEAHDGTKDPIPLYTAPPTRKPLSDGEIRDGLDGKNGFENWYDDRFVDGVRFAEKHHGIGGEE
jgi:hypothetical protein